MDFEWNNHAGRAENSGDFVLNAPKQEGVVIDSGMGASRTKVPCEFVESELCPKGIKCEKTETGNMEHFFNNFSDMLQAEMHVAFEDLRKSIVANGYETQMAVCNMHSEIKEKYVEVIERQEETIQKQHQAISRFQEDLLYKSQKPLIMELIGIADNIRMILQEQREEKNYESLYQAVESLEKWVEATLSNNSVRVFKETENSVSELNRKCQEVIDTEETDDPEKNNTYICERPGYVWTMPYLVVNSEVQLEKIVRENASPRMFSYVIRPEEVVKLKYKEV